MKIDFVLLWVDGSDKKWSIKKSKYTGEILSSALNSNERYRDYDTLKYWFRSIEKYANWVNHIFLVTDNQCPSWLNSDYSKVSVVDHKDFLDERNLPVFNSNAIELNLDKIKGLSENFVLFNDDFFVNDNIKKNIFFENGIPKDSAIITPIIPIYGGISNINNNNIQLINKYYDKKNVIKNHYSKFFNFKYGTNVIRTLLMSPWNNFPGFLDLHIAIPYTKTQFRKARELAPEEFKKTSANKFRTNDDISHSFIRYKRMVDGEFIPRSMKVSKYYSLKNIDNIISELSNPIHPLICINDAESYNFDKEIQQIRDTLENKFNFKSKFEK
ncbi:Stealth CR1 domain-containing protein [Companilactobacillus sp. HBUAS59699]|uniref:Stealth CR1 domain-containing protein n=1 Tax=Companilactobacillus sp. HBUAS59699 TaxID=3109358 RepID=UPI002FEF5D2C